MTAVRPDTLLMHLCHVDAQEMRVARVRVDQIAAILDSPAGCLVLIGGMLWVCPDMSRDALSRQIGWA